jgi:hypothetical protein
VCVNLQRADFGVVRSELLGDLGVDGLEKVVD